MGTIELRLQNLENSELMNAEFESEADVVAWLQDRPPFVMVLGLATPGLSKDLITALKNATRPLDEAERDLARKLDDAQRAAIEKQMAAEEARARAMMDQHREAMRNADPNRPMSVRWSLEDGFSNSEPGDDRAVTDAAKTAILAWVAERTEWVAERGMVCGEANVSVWPGPLPAAADGQRVQRGGTFVPVPAPKAK